MANVYLNTKRLPEAVQTYTQALRYAPNDPSVLLNRSKAFYLMGKLDLARQDYRNAARNGASEPGYEEALR
jgi:tetratricopeptide (TPR) repeat protein